ncbi:hypothetical protein VTL71DRAFT_3090 [Oculimacula yallundae]|uniref:Uncharacterized protein n=1 Tax=Oculimacula yallundae TaxID=86028 RepID=A0ABR4C677_9HELO
MGHNQHHRRIWHLLPKSISKRDWWKHETSFIQETWYLAGAKGNVFFDSGSSFSTILTAAYFPPSVSCSGVGSYFLSVRVINHVFRHKSRGFRRRTLQEHGHWRNLFSFSGIHRKNIGDRLMDPTADDDSLESLLWFGLV